MLKRNDLSPAAVALVDFHDSMEEILTAADSKDSGKVLELYPMLDEKLKSVEADLKNEDVAQIRKNLEDLRSLAESGENEKLSEKGAVLKSSFIKVYLKEG